MSEASGDLSVHACGRMHQCVCVCVNLYAHPRGDAVCEHGVE